MMEEWKEYTVQELIDKGMLADPMDGNHGEKHPKASDYVDTGVPFIMANDLVGGSIDFDNCSFISDNQALTLVKGFAKPGDVLLTHKATIGRTAIVPDNYKTIILTPQVTYYRIIKGIDNKYLKYYFDTPYFQGLLNNWAGSGSTRAYLGITAQHKLPIILPDIETQRRIASILSSLDDKIELNRRINENLEAQAQALFKSWFVDFESFRDGEFVESELGMIPKGWRVGNLSEFAEISKSSINPQKQPQTVFVHYSIPSYDDGMKPELQLGEEIKSNKFVIVNKMTLFSKLNPRIKRVWYVENLSPNSVCSTEFVPYKAKEEALSSFLHGLINSQGFYDFVMAMVNGATGSHQRFHPEDSLKFQIAFNEDYVKNYCLFANPILNRILTNNKESRRLATLRDTLLPRLMSGELKVNEIEREIQ